MKTKRKNTSVKRSFLALCMLCAAVYMTAQDSGGETEKVQRLAETISVLQGSQSPDLTIQSISTVSGDRLLHRPAFMMESALDGVLPGLYVDMSQGHPTEQRALSLRGRSPMIVVDGVPRSDVNLPASQIESISVIKDGLGLSMMGMSSGNGIVYIKTKRGQVSKMKIDFTAQLAFNQQIFRPSFLGAYDYASLLNEALVNDGKSPMYSQSDLTLYRTGASPYTHPDVDWQDVLLRNTAPTQQYNLNLSGGGKNARYFIDLNVYDQAGFLKQDNSINSYNTQENFKKYSLRTNTDISLTDHTLLKVNLFGQMFRETTPGKALMGGIYRDMYSIPNNAFPVFNPDGTLGATPIYQSNNLYGQSILSGYNLYPKTDFNIDVMLEHKFTGKLEGLYLSGLYSYSSTYREGLNRSKNFETWSYWKDPTDPSAEEIYQQMSSSSAQENKSTYSRLNRMQYMELALGYDFLFGKNNFKTKLLYAYNDYMASAKNIPLRKNAISFRGEYNFDRKYMAEFAMSAMSLNSLKPGSQWGCFPSVGAGWNIHEEDWFDMPAVNRMKLRGTFGINGNDGTGSYYRSGTGTLSDYYYNYIKYYGYDGNAIYFGKNPSGNQMLTEKNMPYLTKWEKITRWNAGIDMEMFDRSLLLTAEYFHDIYSDQLQKAVGKDANNIIGLDIPKENLGKSRRNGFELDLSYSRQFGDVYFTASGNATFYWSELLANGEYEYPEYYMQRVGEKIGQTFGYVSDGFFNSQEEIDEYLATTKIEGYIPQPGDLKYRDLNGDHVLDGKDVKAIGNKGPVIDYGIYLGAEWKGLAFSMQWSGRGNAETSSKMMPFSYNASGAYGQALEEHLDRWTPENTDARYPRVSAGSNEYNERTSTFWMQNASYLRLKNIELSYTLPAKWTKPMYINSLKFFVNGYNLITVSALKDRDPELIGFLNGTDSGIVPNTKAYNIGINIQF